MSGLSNGGDPTTTARFNGECAECGEWIDEGDTITKTENGWVCPDCATGDGLTPAPHPRRREFPPRTSLDEMGY